MGFVFSRCFQSDRILSWVLSFVNASSNIHLLPYISRRIPLYLYESLEPIFPLEIAFLLFHFCTFEFGPSFLKMKLAEAGSEKFLVK